MKQKISLKFFMLIVLLSYIGISFVRAEAYIQSGSTNSINTRGKCYYELKGNLWAVSSWDLLTPAAVYNGNWDPCATCLTSENLHVKWKNVKKNAYPSSLIVWYANNTKSTWIDLNPFTLYMPAPLFTIGTSLNIPCYTTNATTISLNSYVNSDAESVGIDQNEVITDEFEWTLPAGWRTSSGQTGTFVSSISISVIPPASSSPASISVRAKANTQYSQPTTLQITRNLGDFDIQQSPASANYGSNVHFEVLNYSGLSYLWQLPTAWNGSSTTNYIDAIAGCSGNIAVTITGCNGTKLSQRSVTTNIIASGTTISSSSNIVCSSGTQFNVPGLVSGTNITWNSSSNLTLSNASSNYCTYSANSNGEGWIEATVNAPACGTSVTLPRKTVWAGPPVTPETIYGFEYNGTVFGQNSIYEFTTYSSDDESVTNYQWVVGGGTILSGQGTNLIEVRTAANSTGITKYFDVSVRVQNACGWSNYLWRSGYIGTGIGPALVISPNPSTAETTLSLVDETNKTAQLTTDWNLDVYDSFQGLKEKKTKLKTSETKINTSGWKDGVYIVRATIGNKVITEKMMVKH